MDKLKFLHVGCGPKRKDNTTKVFNSDLWEEVTLDIDPNANPDIILVGFVEMLNDDQSKMTALFMNNSSFQHISAVKNNKVFAIDIGKYLNFGPTFVSNAMKLIELIND